MKTEILDKYVGELVNLTLNDDSVLMGKLEHMPDHGQRYGFFRPVYYIIGDTRFRSSEVKAFGLLEVQKGLKLQTKSYLSMNFCLRLSHA